MILENPKRYEKQTMHDNYDKLTVIVFDQKLLNKIWVGDNTKPSTLIHNNLNDIL